LRYRPFGRAGVSVSAVALTVDDRAGQRGAEALAGLIYAAMEAGVNTFHIESCEPEVLQTVGQSLAAVDRRLLFVSLRLGLRPGRTGLTRDFSPDGLTDGIDQALAHTGLEHLDLVLLDEPGEDELPTTALTALKQQRTTGRLSLVGVGGAHDAMDAYLGVRDFDVLASPHHLRSGWKEQNRLKTAARSNMGVIAYDYFPEIFHQTAAAAAAAATTATPTVAPKKRGLFGAAAAGPSEPEPQAGASTYAFLHQSNNWTAEELCLAYALMEPAVSTVLIRADEPERLAALAAVPDRDLPPGVAAQVEMARFGRAP
jgi:aryl-alcohol dehydrogenase-like predicted oxidoreductase